MMDEKQWLLHQLDRVKNKRITFTAQALRSKKGTPLYLRMKSDLEYLNEREAELLLNIKDLESAQQGLVQILASRGV
jgi:hypothetical protein